MLNWIKNIFSAKQPLANAAENKYYIEKYKDFDRIIATKFQTKDASGKQVEINGIVTPLKVDNRQQCSMPDN